MKLTKQDHLFDTTPHAYSIESESAAHRKSLRGFSHTTLYSSNIFSRKVELTIESGHLLERCPLTGFRVFRGSRP